MACAVSRSCGPTPSKCKTAQRAHQQPLRCQASASHSADPKYDTTSSMSSTSDEADVWSIREASDTAGYRAAAYLRASCFFSYRTDRSEFAQRAHRRMKADAEWESLENKVQGRELGWESVKVVPLLATIPYFANDPLCENIKGHMMDLSARLPAEHPADGTELVVGTLDLNIGRTLPAEELIGREPAFNAEHTRGYLSNVCVAEGARRLGVAMDLIRSASRIARERGVLCMYVHVVYDNAAALKLYQAAGYEVESEESGDAARRRQHGRRLLLCNHLLWAPAKGCPDSTTP